MKIVLVFVHAALIIYLVYLLARRWRATKNKLFWSTFMVHLVVGMCVGLIYTFYYSANDTWLFFEDAKRLSDLARQDFTSYLNILIDFGDSLYTGLTTEDFRSLIFIKILSTFSLVTGDNYWLCTAYFSVLSFAASWFLFRKITDHFPNSFAAATLAFLIFPSVVFWSSGIEKETLTLTSLYFLAGIFLQIILDKKVDKIILVLGLFASAILWALKYYWAGVFFIAVIAAFAVRFLSGRFYVIRKYLITAYILFFCLIGVAVSFLHPNFYLHRFLEVVVSNHDAFVPLSADSNLIHFYNLSPEVGSVLINSPWALISGIFRPFVGEGQGVLGWVASMENLVVLILLVSQLWSFRKLKREPCDVLFLATVSYCIVLCIFLALSTPNFGTLSRYRVGFLPFLIFILSYRNPLVDSVTKKFLTWLF